MNLSHDWATTGFCFPWLFFILQLVEVQLKSHVNRIDLLWVSFPIKSNAQEQAHLQAGAQPSSAARQGGACQHCILQ